MTWLPKTDPTLLHDQLVEAANELKAARLDGSGERMIKATAKFYELLEINYPSTQEAKS